MKSAAIRTWLVAGLLACFVSSGTAQQVPAVGAGNDPRVGLKAGLAAVQTCRGSHTHTVVDDPKDTANVYIYGSRTGAVRSADELAGCSDEAPEKDDTTALFSIDVIQVPLAAPQNAKIVNRPRIFADPATGAIAGLEKGGERGPGTQPARVTSQCHDITAYPEIVSRPARAQAMAS